ncbi:MAG: hypothetical protein FWF49_06330 [Oscillospiraceae bacterium]|nr:hypothetical protein [Oscillospiraceae bacterium]
MSKGVSGFMRGMGIGMAVGCVAGAVGSRAVTANKKGIKHNIGKALRNVGEVVDNVSHMF